MHLHFCGDLAHDIPMFVMWALSFAPDWVPSIGAVRAKLAARLRGAHG